eukprot:SM000031S11567  [mRNA]  locus=s31:374788:375926:- [translate_table: standard]
MDAVAQTPAGAAGAALLLDPAFGGVALIAALAVVFHLWLGSQVIAARSRCSTPAAVPSAAARAPLIGAGDPGFRSRRRRRRRRRLLTDDWRRSRYGVNLPIMYATETDSKQFKEFNCVQRGHQQALEILPQFLVLLVLGGLQHPYTATIGGVLYLLGRFFYFAGYSQGDPSKRLSGGGGRATLVAVAFVQGLRLTYVIGLLVELACTLSLSVHLGAQLFAQKRV